jgi:hypothetical protein
MSRLARPAKTPRWPFGLGALILVAMAAGPASAAEPAKPVAQPAKPVAQPAPAAQPAKPVAQPAKPVAQPAKPVAQPAKPVAQPAKPVAQPAPAAQPAKPAPRPAPAMIQCDKAAARIAKSTRFSPSAVQRELARVARLEPNCVKAPEAAYAPLESVWGQMLPDARGRVPASVVRGELGRYKRHVALLEAMMAFPRSPRRTFVALKLGELHEAMSAYLDQVGTGPSALMVSRAQPESLYHTRAVDMNEHLRLEAEAAYQRVLDLTANSTQPNALRDQARARLDALRSRFSERRAEERAAAERARAKEAERAASEGRL